MTGALFCYKACKEVIISQKKCWGKCELIAFCLTSWVLATWDALYQSKVLSSLSTSLKKHWPKTSINLRLLVLHGITDFVQLHWMINSIFFTVFWNSINKNRQFWDCQIVDLLVHLLEYCIYVEISVLVYDLENEFVKTLKLHAHKNSLWWWWDVSIYKLCAMHSNNACCSNQWECLLYVYWHCSVTSCDINSYKVLLIPDVCWNGCHLHHWFQSWIEIKSENHVMTNFLYLIKTTIQYFKNKVIM